MSRATAPDGSPSGPSAPDRSGRATGEPARPSGAVAAALGQIVPGAVVAVVVAVALTALTAVETFTRLGLPDPGPVVTYGLPVARALTETAAVVTVGALLLAAVLAAPAGASWLGADGYRAVRIASVAAASWTVGASVTTVLVIADTLGRPVSEVLDGAILLNSVSGLPAANGWFLSALVAFACCVLCRLALSWAASLAALGVALAGLLPVAFTGHSSSGGAHDLAVNSLVLHLLAAALWIGGLVAVLVHAVSGGEHLPTAVRRFSAVALACWIVLAVSGTVNALVRVEPADVLTSTYGLMLLGKAVALVGLGAFGARHRASTVPAVAAGSRSALVRLGGVEVLLMFATLGLAVALGRTAPPNTATTPPSSTEGILGYSLDGPLDVAGVLTASRPDLLLGAAAVVAACAYLVARSRVRRAGREWPADRTVAFVAGCAALVVATSSGIGRYAPAQFSVHALQLALLGVLVPALLVAGRPVLLVRTRCGRAPDPGPSGPQEWVDALGRSAVGRVLTTPWVATVLFVGTFAVVIRTGSFDVLVASHGGHLAMSFAVLGAGALFLTVLLTDRTHTPTPAPLVRAGLVTVAAVALAAVAWSVATADRVLGAAHWAELDLTWVDRASDQVLGAVLFGIGTVVPLLVVLVVVLRRRANSSGTDAQIRAGRTPVAR